MNRLVSVAALSGVALAAVGCTHTVHLYVAVKPATAHIDVQAVLSAGPQQGLTGTMTDVTPTGSAPLGTTEITIPISGNVITPGTKVRLVVSARNSCTSPDNFAQISLFFNNSATDSRIDLGDQPPSSGHTYYMRDYTGDTGVLSANLGGSKLLVDSVGSAGKCQSFKRLGTFSRN